MTLDASTVSPMPYRAELERLHELHLQLVHQQQLIDASVQFARDAGATWEQIGDALDMTKQGAQQRFGSSAVDKD